MNAAVGVLVILKQGNECSGGGDYRVVQSVAEVDIAIGVAVTEVQSTRLESVKTTGTVCLRVAVA